MGKRFEHREQAVSTVRRPLQDRSEVAGEILAGQATDSGDTNFRGSEIGIVPVQIGEDGPTGRRSEDRGVAISKDRDGVGLDQPHRAHLVAEHRKMSG